MRATSLIDLDHLDRYVVGDDALRDEVLGIFEAQAEMWSAMLDPDAEDATWRDTAHALKGAARGVGAWQIGDICAEAETLTGWEPQLRERRCELLDRLRQTGQSTIDEIRALRDSTTPGL